jgi:hypothetical protein
VNEDVSALLCAGKIPLSDAQQFLLVMYLAENGVPDWSDYVRVCARLFHWPISRAEKALEECRAKKWTDRPFLGITHKRTKRKAA